MHAWIHGQTNRMRLQLRAWVNALYPCCEHRGHPCHQPSLTRPMERQRHRVAVVVIAIAAPAKRSVRPPLLEVTLRRNKQPRVPSLARIWQSIHMQLCAFCNTGFVQGETRKPPSRACKVNGWPEAD